MSRMKSRPASATIASLVILVSCFGISGLSAKSAGPKEGFSYTRFLLYTVRADSGPILAFVLHLQRAPSRMLELKDHYQLRSAGGVWDLTFAAGDVANVKSTPLVPLSLPLHQ